MSVPVATGRGLFLFDALAQIKIACFIWPYVRKPQAERHDPFGKSYPIRGTHISSQ